MQLGGFLGSHLGSHVQYYYIKYKNTNQYILVSIMRSKSSHPSDAVWLEQCGLRDNRLPLCLRAKCVFIKILIS